MTTLCPCGTGKSYLDCCGIFITNQKPAPTPETLMRSRYTAYTQANVDYIARTMKSPASDHFDADDARKWAQQVKWLKLEVKKASQQDTVGFVEFVAYFSANNKQQAMHETSEFHFEDGQWFYVRGK